MRKNYFKVGFAYIYDREKGSERKIEEVEEENEETQKENRGGDIIVKIGLCIYVFFCLFKAGTIEVLTCVLSKLEGSDKDGVRYRRTTEHRIV